MASTALYRRYRPQVFEDVLGQEHVTETLQRSIKEGRIAHAYLFSGSRGTGKTSTARIFAKALNCERGPAVNPCNECETCRSITDGTSLDVIEIDAASHGGVDDVRDLRENALLAPAIARHKVYIIDEAHMVSNQGWNAFLKTVEEPPEHVIFVFATTEPHKVLPTILSRCQRFDFRRISSSTLAGHLAKICADEGVAADEGALQLISRHAEGGARDALSVLDQLASAGTVTLEATARLLGSATTDELFAFLDSLTASDTASAIRHVGRLVEDGQDLRVFARTVVDHIRALLLYKQIEEPGELVDATDETRARLRAQADSIPGPKLMHLVRLFVDALTEMRQQAAPRLTVELAVVRATMPEVDDTAAAAITRIERLERLLAVGEVSGEQTAAPQPQTPAAAKAPRAPQAAAAAKPAPEKSATAKPSRAKAAPKPEEPSSPPSVPAARASVDLETIHRSWPLILEEVRKRSKRMHSMLAEANPRAVEDDALVLEARFAFHAEEIARPANARAIGEAFTAVLGVAPRLRATVVERAPERADDPADIDDTRIAEPSPDAMDILRAGFGDDIEAD